jgi:anti-sigma regulatory factor (Ser/Thr protein kinase)
VVPATPEHLADLHGALASLWREVAHLWPRPPDAIWQAQFATGVGEIGANIIQYAYAPDSPGSLGLRLRVFDQRIEACFSDTGQPYVASPDTEEPDVDVDLPSLVESGRGIAITRAAVDELTYDRGEAGTNHWVLVKRRLDS